VTWAISVPSLVFLGLSDLELGPMYATDRCQTDRQTDVRRQTKAPVIDVRGRTVGGMYIQCILDESHIFLCDLFCCETKPSSDISLPLPFLISGAFTEEPLRRCTNAVRPVNFPLLKRGHRAKFCSCASNGVCM